MASGGHSQAGVALDGGLGELAVLYKYVYVLHTEFAVLLFVSMLLACFSVVAVLLLKQRNQATANPGLAGASTPALAKRRVFFSTGFAGGPSVSAIRA